MLGEFDYIQDFLFIFYCGQNFAVLYQSHDKLHIFVLLTSREIKKRGW